MWFSKKKECAHCKENTTNREFEDQPTWADCQSKILMNRESTRTCPIDSSELIKEHNNGIIIDRCPQCNGVWLDSGEIEAIKEAAKVEGIGVGMVVF